MPPRAEASIKLDFGPMERLVRSMGQALVNRSAVKSKTGANPIDNMFKAWAFIYSAFVRRRFQEFSRGAGDWESLAPSTIAAKGSAIILKDIGILFGGLSIGSTGNETKRIFQGVQYGFGGSATHPNAQMTIKKLAEIHQNGLGNVPEREIIVQPNAPTISRMMMVMKKAFDRKW